MTQWFFRITAYADELREYELPEGGGGPSAAKTIQRNWIGRSEGAEILLPRRRARPRPAGVHDAARHAVRRDVLRRRARASVRRAARRTRRCASTRSTPARAATEDRAADEAKTGVFTGHHVTNPVNGERLPDLGRRLRADGLRHRRDHGRARARRARPRVRRDVRPADRRGHRRRRACWSTPAQFDGLPADEAKRAIVASLASRDAARATVSYRLRDWSFSRQRYWGCPIPIIHCDDCGIVPVPDDELPVLLPDIDDYQPKGKAPLASNEEWLRVPCPRCGGEGRREADTMDTFVDSSWYFLRYVDPHNDQAPFDRDVVDYWLPVSQYIGGIDHADRPPAVLALLRQGAERHGHGRLPRAVRAPVPPGLGADGRLEDVEDEGQRRGAGRARRASTAPTRCG